MEQYIRACKAYDLRWVYQRDIDERMAYWLWLQLGWYMRINHQQWEDPRVVLGCDARLANNTLVYWLVRGLEDAGIASVVLLWHQVECAEGELWWGVTSTSVLYYIAHEMQCFGIQCTASHNPAEYVGMKIVGPDGHLMSSELIKRWLNETPSDRRDSHRHGFVTPREEEIERIRMQYSLPRWELETGGYDLKREAQQCIVKMYARIDKIFGALPCHVRLVVDYAQWAWVGYERAFLRDGAKRYGHDLVELWPIADWTFSLHGSDTTDYTNYRHLQDAVLAHHADLGIMFDGDADRIGLVDELGNVVSGDVLVAWLVDILWSSPGFLSHTPQAIIYDVGSTQAIHEVAERYGIVAVPSKIWQRFLKEKFHQHHALFAGELSGHLFFSATHGHEFVLYALTIVMQGLCMLTTTGRTLCEHLTWLMPYYKTPLRNVHVDNPAEVLSRLREACQDMPVRLDETDGIKIFTDRGWVLVRASNTEPVIRICAEAIHQEDAEWLLTWVLTFV
jgi:phosphomannomutase